MLKVNNAGDDIECAAEYATVDLGKLRVVTSNASSVKTMATTFPAGATNAMHWDATETATKFGMKAGTAWKGYLELSRTGAHTLDGGSANVNLTSTGNVLVKNKGILRTADAAGIELPAVSGHGGKLLSLNTAADALEFVYREIELPATSGHAGKVLAVNSAGNGVEWVTSGSSSSSSAATAMISIDSNSSYHDGQLGADIDGDEGNNTYDGFFVRLSGDGTVMASCVLFAPGGGTRYGSVRVHKYSSSSWTEITPTSNPAGFHGDQDHDKIGSDQGIALSYDGTIIAMGETAGNGRVRVYKNTSVANKTWTQLGSDLTGGHSNSKYGTAVALNKNGTILAVGAMYGSSTNNASAAPGSVSCYAYTSNSWHALGQVLYGAVHNDKFGQSVSLSNDGDVLAAGGSNHDNAKGYVQVWQRDTSSPVAVWTQRGSDIDGEANSDQSGQFVSLSGDDGTLVAIGAMQNDGAGNAAGHVRVFEFGSSNWSQRGSDIDGQGASFFSGACQLSHNGRIVVCGSYGHDGPSGSTNQKGHVRVHYWNTSTTAWTKIGSDVEGADAGELFGYTVAINGDGSRIAAGAYLHDSGKGTVRVYSI